jgi:hypothetical protein
MNHPLGDDARLAAPRSGNNQQRPFTVFDRSLLLWVELEVGIHGPIIPRTGAGKQGGSMKAT